VGVPATGARWETGVSNEIESNMAEKRVFPPSVEFSEGSYVKNLEEYRSVYQRSVDDPQGFWGEVGGQVEWVRKWDQVLVEDFANAKHSWFVGGKLNVSYNCVDRHVRTFRKNKVAFIWEGDDGDVRTMSYQQLHREVCRFSNVLKTHGVKKGDRVGLYLPMMLELPVAMLACARIGAVHNVVFGGFSSEALGERLRDSGAVLLVCADGYFRGGRVIRSKDNADIAVAGCPLVKDVIVVRRADIAVTMAHGRDRWWHEEMATAGMPPYPPPEVMDAEDPLFILYTSGSTGKPKGVVHTQAGYLVYTLQTFKWVFDIKEDDTYWCTADIAWITGHSYIVYGPLACGATTLIFEGVPSYPHPDRFWDIVEKHRVNTLYTSPTALRALMREGDEWVGRHDLSSLRLLGSVGEPINPEAWMWYYNTIGKGRCPIVDTWWQTETGGIALTPLPGATPLKPGSATLPFPGIVPAVVREDGSDASVNEGGYLVIRKPWPGLMKGIWGDPKRFRNAYFLHFPGVYTTGDTARIDEDGYCWMMGRIDDVMKISGHRIGTAEVESALVSHPDVAEAAVVGLPDEIKGQGIYAFVTLKAGVAKTEELKRRLVAHVRNSIGPIATPDEIQFADALPKTRSGKIMRRILTKVAAADTENLGDTSTLADPSVVEMLIHERTAR
jgi:acetyl-CoA synthetase